MKKLNVIVAFLLCLSFIGINIAKADEGMWIPMLIGKNYDQMKKQGFKLTPEDLYSINKASIKDAIVSFGGFCTGEIVSKNGLIFTNHHCGYDAIASHSTPQDNILDNGFWAKSHQEEKPVPGLFVNFLVRIDDVTSKIDAATKGLEGAAKTSKYEATTKQIIADATKGTGYDAYIRDFYKGNQYFLFIVQKFSDIRLVGTAPQSIGKFGGDTDNWVWPRHTGDFSVFRVYAGADNKPAQYAAANKPYTPKKYLPVSIKGIKNGDFSMVYGYPGRTDRFLTSQGVKMATDQVSPTIVKLRDIRLKAWKEEMDKDVATRLNFSSKYAQIANYWKYYIGQTEQLKRLKIYEEKQKQETEFTNWAAGKPEFATLIEGYSKAYAAYEPFAIERTYINEGFLATDWVKNVMYLAASAKAGEAQFNQVKQALAGNQAMDEYKKLYNENADKKIFAKILASFYSDVPVNRHPKFYAEIAEKNWKGNAEDSFKKYADYLWENSQLIAPERLAAFLAKNPSVKDLEADPAYQYARNLIPAQFVKENMGSVISDFETKKAELDHSYLKALLEKNKGKLMYPDANSTMRVTYGNVQNYSPKDGITYNVTTTIDGLMQKYIPGDSEFDVPQSLRDAYYKRDFRQYGQDGTLIVNFITNNDITGGNSGSPVINGQGELIGLAFDGNWEAMSGDIAFDKQYKRTICVDTRYVLWCIDVLGGAKNIINELDIRKDSSAAQARKKK